MSSPLLPRTPPPPPRISAAPPPPRISAAPPPLSPRTFIPPHVYRHPAAILLELCTSTKELRQFIPLVIKNGLYDEHLFQTKLVSLFCKFGSLNDAVKVFDSVESKIDPLYHTLLKGHAQRSDLDTAVEFFCRMKRDGVRPVVYNYSNLLKACADNFDVRRGKEIHAQLVLTGFSGDSHALTGVMNLYAKCRAIEDARKVFDRMPERDLVCWNTVIGAFSQNGMPIRALGLVPEMQKDGFTPDLVTVVSILPAAASTRDLKTGRSIHGYMTRRGLESYVNVATALLDMYAKCGSIEASRRVFELMGSRTVVSWNSMIDGYSQSGNSKEALDLFQKMLDEGLKPSNVTVMGALHACADLCDINRGQFIHGLVNQLKLDHDASVVNSLISMYCKCKRVDLAETLFYKLKEKTLVSWNAMILGYAQNGFTIEAIGLFGKMQQEKSKCDSFTLVSVITAVAELSVLRQAKWVHGLTIRMCLDKNIFVTTALVDMYAKCGAIRTARKLFDLMDEKHVTTWNAMIDGYGTHGFGKEAVELFEEMRILKTNSDPDEVTFLCVISACSHSGLVDEGKSYFSIMKEEFGLEPSMDHYGAIVDLLGRAGQLNEAWEFIQEMPVEPGINVYGAMLGACKIHKNVDLGEQAADKLFDLKPEDGGYHVLLANIYSMASMWEKVGKTRMLMEKGGIRKTPGYSSVDLRNEMHTFYSGSTSHPQSEKIYAHLEKLMDKIKAAGYVPDTSSFHDVEDDVQEKLVSTHSEKLAISFGLISTGPGTTIHIRKNLRVCVDCHNATKFISLVTEREIIVRDMHRFHHFKNGKCSCGDYW